jgi:small subunit ribosomal protein S20
MPNKQAAIKELRKNKRRATSNARVKTNVSHLFKKTVSLINADKLKEAKENYTKFQQAVDKAAKRNIISSNMAARKKSNLAKTLKKKSQAK